MLMAGVGENENEGEAAATAFQPFQHKRGEVRASDRDNEPLSVVPACFVSIYDPVLCIISRAG